MLLLWQCMGIYRCIKRGFYLLNQFDCLYCYREALLLQYNNAVTIMYFNYSFFYFYVKKKYKNDFLITLPCSNTHYTYFFCCILIFQSSKACVLTLRMEKKSVTHTHYLLFSFCRLCMQFLKDYRISTHHVMSQNGRK
jgi:hypothetical protein